MVRPLNSARSHFLSRPLNAVFGAPGHIGILRALADTEVGLSGRQVGRAARIAQRTAMEGLSRLEAAGIVRRQSAGGAYLFRLNSEHVLVKEAIVPLLGIERALRGRLKSFVAGGLRKPVATAALFGSAARGEEGPESDFDVCLLVEHPEEKERASAQAHALFERAAREFGVRLAPIVFTRREFVRGFRAGEPLHKSIVRESEVFRGPSFSEVVGG